MFRSKRFENGERPALDEPSRMDSRNDAHSRAGPATGINRRMHYGSIPRVTVTSGWKATFM